MSLRLLRGFDLTGADSQLPRVSSEVLLCLLGPLSALPWSTRGCYYCASKTVGVTGHVHQMIHGSSKALGSLALRVLSRDGSNFISKTEKGRYSSSHGSYGLGVVSFRIRKSPHARSFKPRLYTVPPTWRMRPEGVVLVFLFSFCTSAHTAG